MRSVWRIAACSALLLGAAGCGLTLGPVTETRYVVVAPGVPVEVLENKTVRCRVLTDESGDVVTQDVGGWVAMPPEHWATVKSEITRLRKKAGAVK